jgi:hypothetical protein
MKKVHIVSVSIVATALLVAATAVVAQKHSASHSIAGDNTSRLYMVRNSSSMLVALKDSDLDQPAKIRKMGNALNVSFQGATYDVESTVIMRGDSVVNLDRYLPSDDSDD